MTDTKLLRQKIDDSGISYAHIARKCGISSQAFYNKINGVTQFRQSEIHAIIECLHLSMKEVFSIFFA